MALCKEITISLHSEKKLSILFTYLYRLSVFDGFKAKIDQKGRNGKKRTYKGIGPRKIIDPGAFWKGRFEEVV